MNHHEPLPIDEIRRRFEADRYVVLRSLIEPGLVSMLYHYIQSCVAKGDVGRISTIGGLDGASESSGDPLMERFLESLKPEVERATGMDLDPTYAFYRVYRTGDRLIRHRDRESCEVSVSLNLGYAGEGNWPLWIAGPNGEYAAELAPSDGLLYRGIECEHWREPLEGAEAVQLFLHYVDSKGPYADWKFDRRGRLHAPGDQRL